MRRLPLVLLAVAFPALGETLDDAAAGDSDAGVPAAALQVDAGVAAQGVPDAGDTGGPPVAPNHHFSLVVDSEPVTVGRTDAQFWLTPRWGRVDSYTAADLRAGMTQGLSDVFALGLFVDATPSATGMTNTPAVDARGTAMGHLRMRPGGPVGLAGELAVSAGLNGISFNLTGIADLQLGPVRFGLNIDGFRDARWNDDGSANMRFRQTFGVGYTLGNGFSVNLEVQNRLSWRDSSYQGLAFLIGPSVGYRNRYFWITVALLPQVAAMKIPSEIGGDPLELTDNERFLLRVSLGALAP